MLPDRFHQVSPSSPCFAHFLLNVRCQVRPEVELVWEVFAARDIPELLFSYCCFVQIIVVTHDNLQCNKRALVTRVVIPDYERVICSDVFSL